jgi:very-short-patch-repair endonuclease
MDEIWNDVAAQHGALARWQARANGKTRWWIEARLRAGDLTVATPNVLLVPGAPRTPEQALMVAVLDAGPGAMATMRASAWLWGLPGFGALRLDVIRNRGERPRDGASMRWPRRVPAHHVTTVRGIPTLTLPRTIFELAGDPRIALRLPRVIDTIDGRTPALLIALHQLLPEVATKGKRGITFMRETLATRPPDRTRLTGMERRFEWILRRAGLSVPRRQIDVGGHSWIGRVDYYDDSIGVIYEIDSEVHHTSLLDRLHDERRDAEALAAGFNEVVRITEEEVWYDASSAVAKVVAARRRWRVAG